MSQRGIEIARHHGRNLPTFSSQTEAEQFLFTWRDKHFEILSGLSQNHREFKIIYKPESLKSLERWYFDLYEKNAFKLLGIDRTTFETCMAMYFGEVTVRNAHAEWFVEAYFLMPSKYELGVRRDLLSVMLMCFTDHFQEPNNKRRQSIFRRYNKLFGHKH